MRIDIHCSKNLYTFIEEVEKNEESSKNDDVEKLRNELERYKYIVLQQEEHIQVCKLCIDSILYN